MSTIWRSKKSQTESAHFRIEVSGVAEKNARDYIVFLGSGNIDTYYTMDEWPVKGSKAVCVMDGVQVGGMISNAASTAAAYGLKCYCLDVLGTDEDEQAIRNDLTQFGIDDSQIVVIEDVHSTKCEVFIHKDERTILVVRNKQPKPKLTLGDTQRTFLRNARFLYSGFGMDWILGDPEECFCDLHAHGVGISFDIEPTSYRSDWRRFARYATIIFFNEFGFERFREDKSEEDFAQELFEMGIGTVVVTLGENGCAVMTPTEKFKIPIYDGVTVKDPTGAGDTFNSSFVSAYVMGWDLKRCACFATAAANMAVMTHGPRGGVRPMQEVLSFMQTHRQKY